ncbi:hypothetical protein EVAR_80651_1 [Eumeta japonica]|uniref:Uncharacterized protein n=1 Tax=Eumeta variegata TaxID=151549 RepID=A0A4C1U447_EUMVA|nr:hypothetical protein EVAR_80651_1 [Eumeta japonica]
MSQLNADTTAGLLRRLFASPSISFSISTSVSAFIFSSEKLRLVGAALRPRSTSPHSPVPPCCPRGSAQTRWRLRLCPLIPYTTSLISTHIQQLMKYISVFTPDNKPLVRASTLRSHPRVSGALHQVSLPVVVPRQHVQQAVRAFPFVGADRFATATEKRRS